jgi:hypothetical protein
MIEDYLMTFDDYNKADHPTPYKYSIEKGGQILYYFGANHSHDPKNEQYPELRKFWEDFLNKTGDANSVVFVEGGKRPVNESEEQAIIEGGEANFITYLASQKEIETFSPEPPEKFRFNELLKKFTKEEIIYYEFARTTFQWNRFTEGEQSNFEDYINKYLSRDKHNSGWDDFDFSIENMIRIQKQMFDREFDKNDKDFFYKIINPTTDFSRINELSRFEDSEFRDRYILQQIEKSWLEGRNIFVVYGCSHAVMHEPALKKLVE